MFDFTNLASILLVCVGENIDLLLILSDAFLIKSIKVLDE